MKTLTYDFPVELTPIVSKPFGTIVPNRFAVVRMDTKEPIGVVSKRYGLIKHKDAVDSMRKALLGIFYEENINMTENGAQMFATFKLSQERVEVRRGDFVAIQFIVKNSYDGESSFQIMLGAFRLVCTNGMVIGRQFFRYSQRHIGSESGGVDIIKLQDKIALLTTQFKKTLPLLQEMSIKRMPHDADSLEKLFNPIRPRRRSGGRLRRLLPRYLTEAAMDKYTRENDQTVWGYYNSFTYALTHNFSNRNPEATLLYGKIAWDIARKVVVAKTV